MTREPRSLNQIAEDYLSESPEQAVNNKIMAMTADFVIDRLPGQRILEMGVGGQVWTPRLAEHFNEVTTVDTAPRLLQVLREKLSDRNWTGVEATFETYAPAALFDTVLCSMVLEHVDDPGEIVERAKSWLKPGGHLAILVPHALSLHRRLAVTMGLAETPGELGPADQRLGHRRCMSFAEVEELLRLAEYQVVERSGLFAKMLPNNLLVKCSDAQLQGMFKLGTELPIEYAAVIYYLAKPN
jgi:SAM-dependent methyltransferase